MKRVSTIHKSSNFNDIPSYDKAYWRAKTPQEQLAAALKLIQRAKAIYYLNPANPPLGNAGQVLKSSTPIDHPKLPLVSLKDIHDLENLPGYTD